MPATSPKRRARSTTAALNEEIAASLDLPPELTPWLADLFAGLHSLGSSPRRAVSMLQRAGLGHRSQVLELACGKGSTAIALAKSVGCRILGIDACKSFIHSARTQARRRGVDHLCDFRVGDVRRAPPGPFDAAVMLGLFPVNTAAPLLRKRIRPGGVYLIDDAFLDDRYLAIPAGFRNVPTRVEVGASIAALGDEVIADHIPTPSQVGRLIRSLHRRLEANSESLAQREPGLKKALRDFLRRQERANTLLRGPLRPGMWLIRRGR